MYNGKRIKILDAIISCDNNQSKESQDIKSQSNKHIIPGEIVMINKKNGLKIMTKDYPIIIKYAQLEGKKPTDGYTLSIQTNFSINDKLGV